MQHVWRDLQPACAVRLLGLYESVKIWCQSNVGQQCGWGALLVIEAGMELGSANCL